MFPRSLMEKRSTGANIVSKSGRFGLLNLQRRIKCIFHLIKLVQKKTFDHFEATNSHFHSGVPHPWCRGAQAPPVFRILSHKNAIKPEKLRF